LSDNWKKVSETAFGNILSEKWAKALAGGSMEEKLVTLDAHLGTVIEEMYFDYAGRLSRIDGPALITQDGGSVHETWLTHGVRHREDGPANACRDLSTGVVLREEWYQHGKLGRENGPAVIVRSADTGTVVEASYWRNGRRAKASDRYFMLQT
jgi:hypothetical protein